MLHAILEKEKDKNYPTIRAILIKYYGQKFNFAIIKAEKRGLASYGFYIALDEKETYFFKIECKNITITDEQKARDEAGFAFMAFVHDTHQENPPYINSAKGIQSILGTYTPILENSTAFDIPADLVGHCVSLQTQVAGNVFSDVSQIKDKKAFDLSSCPIETTLLITNNIIDVQRAGDEFANQYLSHAKTLNEECARVQLQPFEVILDVMFQLSLIRCDQLDEMIQNKLRETYDALTQYVPNKKYGENKLQILHVQNLFKDIALEKGCFLFNEQEPFGSLVYKASKFSYLDPHFLKLGNYLHQLDEARLLSTWIKEGTVGQLYDFVKQLESQYKKACNLKKARLVTHDANIGNYVFDSKKQGKDAITRVDLLLYLSAGPRIYDLGMLLNFTSCPLGQSLDRDTVNIIVNQFDERERLSKTEIKSLLFLYKAVEIGNKVNGLISLMYRASTIEKLGTDEYDKTIHPHDSLLRKKEMVDSLAHPLKTLHVKSLIKSSREQTCDALNLMSTCPSAPSTILQRNSLFSKPSKHQKKILSTVEFRGSGFFKYPKDDAKKYYLTAPLQKLSRTKKKIIRLS